MRTRFEAVSHIPRFSADPEYRIVEVNSRVVVAVIDPNMVMDDPLTVAVRMTELLNSNPEYIL